MHKKGPLITVALLAANGVISWTILPFLILPSHGYTILEWIEVLYWQVVAFLGWPFAIFGLFLSLFPGQAGPDLFSVLIILVYPAMLLLLLREFFAEDSRRWEVVLLHLLLALSFGVLWFKVRQGVEIMLG